MGDELCNWFFEVLRGWANGEAMFEPRDGAIVESGPHLVGQVVQFATGTSRAPAGGWAHLRNKTGKKQPFQIQKIDETPDQMPRAHTCFNRIDLVVYSSRAKLAEQLYL